MRHSIVSGYLYLTVRGSSPRMVSSSVFASQDRKRAVQKYGNRVGCVSILESTLPINASPKSIQLGRKCDLIFILGNLLHIHFRNGWIQQLA